MRWGEDSRFLCKQGSEGSKLLDQRRSGTSPYDGIQKNDPEMAGGFERFVIWNPA